MENHVFCICENKDADQLCGYCTADQPLCFHFIDNMIRLCLALLKTPKTCFVMAQLIFCSLRLKWSGLFSSAMNWRREDMKV